MQPSEFKNSWSHHCSFCETQLLKSEDNGWCCLRGKHIVPRLPPYPAIVEETFASHQAVLCSISRKLNNLFAFTILGVTGGFQSLPTPSNVAISGRVYHQILDISQGNHSLRWFLYDEAGRNIRAVQQQVPQTLVACFREFLNRVNPYIHQLRASFDPTNVQHLSIELHQPTSSGEVAAVIHGNNLHQVHPRNILIQQNGQPAPQRIDILSPFYEPLQYPILFPHGTLGWCPNSPMSQIRWYRSRILSESRFTKLGRLAGEYLVDMYSRVEDERLDYIRRALHQQYSIRTQYSSSHRNNNPVSFTGSNSSSSASYHEQHKSRGIVLPSSFLGSKAWAAGEVADSLAICRSKGKPSFFITITTNPNWPEIVEQLGPGQTASDIPLVVCRTFKARMEAAIRAIKKFLGTVVYIVRVVEFQKRGLPHAHIVVKVFLFMTMIFIYRKSG